MNEKRYPAKYCPYCATPYTTPTHYCEVCGKEKLWMIEELQPASYPWSPKQAFLMTGLTYGFFTLLTVAILVYYLIFFGIPLPLLFDLVLNDPFLTAILTFSELVFILVPVAFVLSLKVDLEKLGITLGGWRTAISDVSVGLLAGVAFVPLILAIASYEIFGTGSPPTPPGPTDLFWVGITLLTIVFIVAPAEELLFRGFLQNSLDAHYGRIGGVLVASVIFGIVHVNPLIGVYQTIIGIFLGLLFQWRGRRLAAPVAAHAIYDCIIILLNIFVF